jgi:hypothetical protein
MPWVDQLDEIVGDFRGIKCIVIDCESLFVMAEAFNVPTWPSGSSPL